MALAPDTTKWAAWMPGEVAEVLAGVELPCYVAGGWALDLFLGGQRRSHADIEIAVPRSRFQAVAEAAPHADEEKHRADFAAVLPLLGADVRRCLAAALELVHPGHVWLDELRLGGPE